MPIIAQHTLSRKLAAGIGIVAGFLIGLYNTLYPPIDFTFDIYFFLSLAAALVVTVLLHEGIHGIAAVCSGHRPIFGIQPPLVYVTFKTKIPRGHFIIIALAPLVVLDVVFGIFFGLGYFKEFSYFCLIINTIGAIGDVWITIKLLGHERGTFVRDTKTGIEVWTIE